MHDTARLEADVCADPSKDYLHMGVGHFAAELQLDDHAQIAKICEALELNIVQDAQQSLIQVPKKVLLIPSLPASAAMNVSCPGSTSTSSFVHQPFSL